MRFPVALIAAILAVTATSSSARAQAAEDREAADQPQGHGDHQVGPHHSPIRVAKESRHAWTSRLHRCERVHRTLKCFRSA